MYQLLKVCQKAITFGLYASNLLIMRKLKEDKTKYKV